MWQESRARVSRAVALMALAALASGCAGSAAATIAPAARSAATAGGGKAGAAATTAPASPSPSPVMSPKPTAPVALPVAPGAGDLPQTRALPPAGDAAFQNAMADLWLAVTTGRPDLALPAFFPLAAYKQIKAIANPAADWRGRLWYDFTLDVAAAHALVGRGATLVRVIVPAQYAAWIYPGGCYNSVGYWHVPGARVEYRAGGQVRSFGIASLISWRGVWYVVHFGAVLRAAASGVVDAPAAGPGVPGPPGGC